VAHKTVTAPSGKRRKTEILWRATGSAYFSRCPQTAETPESWRNSRGTCRQKEPLQGLGNSAGLGWKK
jgi:hypothetical protein